VITVPLEHRKSEYLRSVIDHLSYLYSITDRLHLESNNIDRLVSMDCEFYYRLHLDIEDDLCFLDVYYGFSEKEDSIGSVSFPLDHPVPFMEIISIIRTHHISDEILDNSLILSDQRKINFYSLAVKIVNELSKKLEEEGINIEYHEEKERDKVPVIVTKDSKIFVTFFKCHRVKKMIYFVLYDGETGEGIYHTRLDLEDNKVSLRLDTIVYVIKFRLR
jgi:hypothetical protein